MSNYKVEEQRVYSENMKLVEKYERNIAPVMNALGSKMTVDKKIVLARCLENTQAAFDRYMMESTQPDAVSGFRKFGFQLISAVLPNLIAQDIVSVQPMPNKIGEIRYLKYNYGSAKGANQNFGTFTSTLNYDSADFNYSSEVVQGEPVTPSVSGLIYTFTLKYLPVRPTVVGKVSGVVIKIGNAVIMDNGAGEMTGALLDAVGVNTINYGTGLVTLTLLAPAGAAIVADYVYNLETVPSTVPEVNIEIGRIAIEARSRKLRALYSFDAAYDLQKDYGTEINTLLLGQVGAEIKHEIDGEIMNDLYTGAFAKAGQVGGLSNFSMTPPSSATGSTISKQAHYDSFMMKIIEGGNVIFGNTKRASANFIIADLKACNVIEAMTNFVRAVNTNIVGPHLVGTVNGIPVYKNPYYTDGNYLIGYKGDGLFDSGFVYAPYMPILTTNLIMMDDFTGRRGFATSYGKQMVNNRLYVQGKVTD